MERDAHELVETIEVLIVELRGVAQPHEIAHFRELVLDAKDARTKAQLAEISRQVESLRAFCTSRAMSGESHVDLPRRRG